MVAALLHVSFQAAAAKSSQDFVFQSSPTMSNALGRFPDLLMSRLQVCLLRKQSVLGAMRPTSWKTPEMLLWAGDIVGLSCKKSRVPAQSMREDCRFPGVQEETKIFQSFTQDKVELGSGGLQTPCSTIPMPHLAAWKPQVHVLQDIQLHTPGSRMILLACLGIRAQHFPKGLHFPLPNPCTSSINTGRPAFKVSLLPLLAPKGNTGYIWKVFCDH